MGKIAYPYCERREKNDYSSVVGTKGQITIPQEVRVRLGLKEGDRVEFVTQGEVTIIRGHEMRLTLSRSTPEH